MNYPLNCWYVIATSDEVGRSLLARTALGRRLLLFRTEDGQAAVLDDRCPHRAAPLSMGTLQGNQVVCQRSGLTVTVPPGQSIIDALEENGVSVLSSCLEGVCGTCETAVLEGVPDHRDSLLSEEEREANEYMMICVGRSKSDRLVLDL